MKKKKKKDISSPRQAQTLTGCLAWQRELEFSFSSHLLLQVGVLPQTPCPTLPSNPSQEEHESWAVKQPQKCLSL